MPKKCKGDEIPLKIMEKILTKKKKKKKESLIEREVNDE